MTHEADCIPSLRLQWRWMIRKDMEEILEIENCCFRYPWAESDFLRILRQRNGIGTVTTDGTSVLGYTIYELFPGRIDLHNLAVIPRMQGKGVGRFIIDKMKRKITEQRRRRLIADVAEFNTDAQLFFRRMGFYAVEIIEDRFENPSDIAAYRFVYNVTPTAVTP